MANSKVTLIPDVNGFCSSNLKMINEVSKEAEEILPIFSEDASAKEFLKDALGYDIDAHTEAAYLVPLNNARLDAVNRILYGDGEPLGPNATEKQINDLVAALKTKKSDLEHYIKAELDDLSDESLQYSKEDLLSAVRAATAQQIQEVVPPHLREKYGEELDKFAAYLDEGASHQSESSHVSLIGNEAGQFKTIDYVYKGAPIVLGAAFLGYVLNQIFGGAGGLSKEVVSDPDVQYDLPHVVATDTPDSPDQIVRDENLPDWLIEEDGLFGLGEKQYRINREKLPLAANGWHVERENNKFNNDVIKPGDGVAEMGGGILDGKAVVIVDEDVFGQYGGDFGFKPKSVNGIGIRAEDCEQVASGIYIYRFELDDKCFGVSAPFPISMDAGIHKENGGSPRIFFGT